ncbi:hypothetical protein POTOM_048918 [Populus tomentosa]|uniref:Uncharacterized protein n=1 Tax=Populus tomentosa TaxID=118781 RepID=A0A8X7Y9G7_POPTO|nr:hypothetical protein POTOM_048918 [Populus tomentosa]
MLCSVKTSKSGSNWLDRLWSNKGFNNNDDDDPSVPNPSSSPITDASNSVINSNSESTHSESDQNKVTTTTTREISSSDNKDLFFLMNNVLSDLFNMGGCSDPIEGSSRHSRKKERIPRKQTKPKFCFVSGNNSSNDSLDCVRKDENVLAATGSLNSDKNSNNVDCGVDDDDDDEEEEEDVEEEKGKGFGVSGDKELKGYSRSEVTVIDTTCLVWKFDKLVFRKKNVWKVRDKKGKSWVSGSKKRKVIDLESANGNGAKKKAKVSNLEVGSSKDANDHFTYVKAWEAGVDQLCHLSSSLFLHYLYAFHWVMFGTSAGNADYNSMPFDGMNGEALSILQVQKPEDERREEVEMAEDHSQVATKRQAYRQALCRLVPYSQQNLAVDVQSPDDLKPIDMILTPD